MDSVYTAGAAIAGWAAKAFADYCRSRTEERHDLLARITVLEARLDARDQLIDQLQEQVRAVADEREKLSYALEAMRLRMGVVEREREELSRALEAMSQRLEGSQPYDQTTSSSRAAWEGSR